MPDNSIKTCPLCGTRGEIFWRDEFFSCPECAAIFRHPAGLPDPETEKAHYRTHVNDVYDAGYRRFVSPITTAVMTDFIPGGLGLDFGAGTGPVISKVLEEKGYEVRQYDPFFHNHPELLQGKYDYIACCEVIEHFFTPHREFKLLHELLNPGGKMYCMTHLFDADTCFDSWYYKNDPTHVFIYRRQTFDWIKHHFDFASIAIEGRLIRFVKR